MLEGIGALFFSLLEGLFLGLAVRLEDKENKKDEGQA